MTVPPLIEAQGVVKHFAPPGGLGARLRGRSHAPVRAVDGVDLALAPGDSLGLVGESGSGKTTMGRLLLALTPPSIGQVRFAGRDVARLDRAGMREFRRQAQLVQQNPYDALNPRFTIGRAIAEPLTCLGVPAKERPARIAEALRRVRLDGVAGILDAYPHQLSGGQLQRAALARALVPGPQFLLADEPVSMLDVSVRAGVLNLLRDLREELNLAALYISHDMTLVRYACARTAVLYLGRVVEEGPTADVVARPAHPYTQALVAAVPRPHVDQPRGPLPLKGAIPGARPTGCPLRGRCPHEFARCVEEPPLIEVSPGHRAACHLHASSTSPGTE